MCDISLEENKAINTQLAMKNIPLNLDVLGVIKSFVFYDKIFYTKKKEQKEKMDVIIQIINSPMGYDMTEYIEEGFAHWAIWLPFPQYEDDDDLQLQASNCLKCGKYVQVSTLELESAIMDNKYIVCVNGEH
jgi:hypothetical protein